MLEHEEMARRVSEALDASPRGVQSKLAKLCGITPQAVTGWRTTGKVAKEFIPVLAKVTGRSIAFFLEQDAGALGVPISTYETPSDYVRVLYLDAEAGMGDGIENVDHPEVLRAIDFAPPYIRSLLGFVPSPGRLVLVTGKGDSMLPVIQPGETLLVDTGITAYDGDGLYLVNTGGGQQVKGLQHRGDAVYVVSANTALYPAFPVPRGAVIGGKVYLRNRIDRLG